MELDDLDDAERFQRMFVSPLVDAVRLEVKPLVESYETLRQRVDKVEKNQNRAIWGLSAAAAIFSVGFGIVLDWFKRKLGIGQ